jgi:hypothetical protein
VLEEITDIEKLRNAACNSGFLATIESTARLREYNKTKVWQAQTSAAFLRSIVGIQEIHAGLSFGFHRGFPKNIGEVDFYIEVYHCPSDVLESALDEITESMDVLLQLPQFAPPAGIDEVLDYMWKEYMENDADLEELLSGERHSIKVHASRMRSNTQHYGECTAYLRGLSHEVVTAILVNEAVPDSQIFSRIPFEYLWTRPGKKSRMRYNDCDLVIACSQTDFYRGLEMLDRGDCVSTTIQN